jgi:hypothetical protein
VRCVDPHLDRGLAAELGEQIAVERAVERLEEHGLAPVAALRHMVREVGNDDASETAMERRSCEGHDHQ